MSPPEAHEPGTTEDWLRHARSDLAYAAARVPKGGLFNVPCFHAQQAVEKAIKAVLIHRDISFERAHSIGYLANLIPADVEPLPMLEHSVALTRFAVAVRYPGDYEDLTVQDQREAAKVALAVVNWAGRIVTV